MFDFGFSEMVLIGLIALIVLGPKRLPEVARSAGHWAGKLRRFVENVKRDIDAEIRDEDLAAFKQMHAELSETRNMLQKSASDTFGEFSGATQEVQQLAEPAAVDEEFLHSSETPVETYPPAAPERKARAKPSSKVPRKTVAKKSVTKKVATKTNRTPHGGVKKT